MLQSTLPMERVVAQTQTNSERQRTPRTTYDCNRCNIHMYYNHMPEIACSFKCLIQWSTDGDIFFPSVLGLRRYLLRCNAQRLQMWLWGIRLAAMVLLSAVTNWRIEG